MPHVAYLRPMEDIPKAAEATAPPRPLWALALSGLFHPLLVPTYMYVLLMVINPFLFGSNDLGDQRAILTLLMIVLYTCVIPLISVIIMVLLNMVGSVMMEDRMERIGPLLLVMVLYFWVYYNLSQSNDVPTIFSSFLLGVVMSLAIAFVINVMDKVSLHTIGMGGLTGMVMISMLFFGSQGIGVAGMTMSLGLLVLLVVILAGLVGSARLALKAHTNTQIYVGYLVGFFCQWAALLFYF